MSTMTPRSLPRGFRRSTTAPGCSRAPMSCGQACPPSGFPATRWRRMSTDPCRPQKSSSKDRTWRTFRGHKASAHSRGSTKGQTTTSNKDFPTHRRRSSQLCQGARKSCRQRPPRASGATDGTTAWIQPSGSSSLRSLQSQLSLRIQRTRSKTMTKSWRRA